MHKKFDGNQNICLRAITAAYTKKVVPRKKRLKINDKADVDYAATFWRAVTQTILGIFIKTLSMFFLKV